MSKKKDTPFVKVMNGLKEIWFVINEFLKESLREFLSKKIVDNILFYLIYLLLIMTICYAGFQLISDIKHHFFEIPSDEKFPFVLKFSEHLFLYFLPIFILFGLLKYYELEWKRDIIRTNPPIEGKNYMNVSKKLFFSSLLSYISLKIIEKLFFEYKDIESFPMLYIGLFFIALIVFVLIQHSHD